MDPYHIWLGIPANEQPADHYRLLGLTRFEGDERVIEAAADRQMTHVRNMQGKHPGLATQILNELSRVRNCLLSPEAKAEYDRQLSASVAVVGPEPSAVEPLAAAPAPVSEAIPPRVAAPLDSIPSVAPAKPSHRRRKQSINPLIFVGVGLFAVVAVGVLLIAVVWIAADRGADAFAEVGDPPPVSSPLTPSPRPIRINPDLPSVEPKPSPPPAVTPAATPAPAPKRTVEPGLVKATFARQPQQQANKGFVPFENLNDVLDPTSTILSVHKWKFPANRNTAAFGLLKIDEPGEYVFKTYNFYDRNALVIGDKVVCRYRGSVRGGPDSGTIAKSKERIQLEAGWVPFVAIGYVDARGSMDVTWSPPSAANLAPIPEDQLFHVPAWRDARTAAEIWKQLQSFNAD